MDPGHTLCLEVFLSIFRHESRRCIKKSDQCLCSIEKVGQVSNNFVAFGVVQACIGGGGGQRGFRTGPCALCSVISNDINDYDFGGPVSPRSGPSTSASTRLTRSDGEEVEESQPHSPDKTTEPEVLPAATHEAQCVTT